MKVLAIMGSPNKMGNSYEITKRIEDKMKAMEDIEFNYLFLKEAHLESCRGCQLCLSIGEDKCPLKDDREAIEKQMLAADGVIFVTPVYVWNVTALMKNFLDRFAYTFHRPRFFEQKAMIICTTGQFGLKEAIDRMALIRFAGFNLIHSAGFRTPHNPVSIKAKKKIDQSIENAAKIFYESMKGKRSASPELIQLIGFRSAQAAFQILHDYHIGECDYNYYKEKGWLDETTQYFVNVKVNPIKNMIAVLMGKMMRRDVAKDLQGVPW
jgi:multimeric flavodoxin WrbA